tara:strand:+ start:75 stop:596 length:522 start_codon:yes stop_codon:yes gene_type:complete
MGWFSSQFNETNRLKVHNSCVNYINQSLDQKNLTISRSGRLKIFSIYIVHCFKGDILDIYNNKEAMASTLENFVEDSMFFFLDRIIYAKNDKFNQQRYKAELIDNILLSSSFYIPEYIDKRIENPNFDGEHLIKETIGYFTSIDNSLLIDVPFKDNSWFGSGFSFKAAVKPIK